ncbi:hydrolase [Rhodobacterales bacterium]|nr:hydrolase [Rhodobacterales bacterium]
MHTFPFEKIDADKTIRVVSTDVFDTLLLRKNKSQTSRIAEAEAAFSKFLATHNHDFKPRELVKARRLAQQMAYRALGIGGEVGEVRLYDIVKRQLQILGLPEEFIQARLDIEIEIEKTSLVPNRDLSAFLRACRDKGLATIAISDTALSADQVADLIAHFHGTDVIDRVYSSADVLASKRHGELFRHVMEQEGVSAGQMLHVGDDKVADDQVPGALGLQTCHVPRHRMVRYRSLANGAAVRSAQMLGEITARAGTVERCTDPTSFGRDVFGPIVAEFCLKIWLYAQQAHTSEAPAALLFCARGGAGIREAYERVVARLGLPADVPRQTLMVSRLIAARMAVERRSAAALDEIGREFEGRSFADVFRALAGPEIEVHPNWEKPFVAADFYTLLESDAGRQADAEIRSQNVLFRRHLAEISGDAKRLILCDTGLYGSTQRLLAAGLPDMSLETVHFARSNYKGFGEEHFARLAGLVVEQDKYDPFRIETVVLRYWHIIESLFEPKVLSVKWFETKPDGNVGTNSADMTYPLGPELLNPLLSGVLSYIDEVRDGRQILTESGLAWRRLKQSIIFPAQADLAVLDVRERSVDFGKVDYVKAIREQDRTGLRQRLVSVRSSLWKEGALCRDFSSFRLPLLLALEMTYSLRGMSARISRH